MATVDTLDIRLRGDIAEFEASMRRARGLMDDLGRGVAGPNAQMRGLGDSMKGLLGTIAGVTGGLLSAGAAMKAFGAGINFNREIETMRLGTASIVSAFHDIKDAQGKTLTGSEKLAAASGATAKVFEQLKKDAIETTATLPQLVGAFQAVVGPASAAKITLDDSRKITVAMVQTMGALGIEMGQARQEIASILNGAINTDSRLANTLGITNDMVRNWKQQGKLADELLGKLDAFVVAGKAAGNTWDGLTSTLKDNLDALAGLATGASFEDLKKRLAEMNNTAFGDDAKRRAVEWGEIIKGALNDALAVAKNVGIALAWAADKFSAGLLSTRAQMIGMGAKIGTGMAREDVIRGTAQTRGLKGAALEAILGPTRFVTPGTPDPGTGMVEGGKVETLTGAAALGRLAKEGKISAAEKTLAEKVLGEATRILAGEVKRASASVYDSLAKAYAKLAPAPVGRRPGTTLTPNSPPPPPNAPRVKPGDVVSLAGSEAYLNAGPGMSSTERSIAVSEAQEKALRGLLGKAKREDKEGIVARIKTEEVEQTKLRKKLADEDRQNLKESDEIRKKLAGAATDDEAAAWQTRHKLLADFLERQRSGDINARSEAMDVQIRLEEQADQAHLARVMQAGQLAAELAAKAIKGEKIGAGDVIRGGAGLAGGAIGAIVGGTAGSIVPGAGTAAGILAGGSMGSAAGGMVGTVLGAIFDADAAKRDAEKLAADSFLAAAGQMEIAAGKQKEAADLAILGTAKNLDEKIALTKIGIQEKTGAMTGLQANVARLGVQYPKEWAQLFKDSGVLPPAGGAPPIPASSDRRIASNDWLTSWATNRVSNPFVPPREKMIGAEVTTRLDRIDSSSLAKALETGSALPAAVTRAETEPKKQADIQEKLVPKLDELFDLLKKGFALDSRKEVQPVEIVKVRDSGFSFFRQDTFFRASRPPASRAMDVRGNVRVGA